MKLLNGKILISIKDNEKKTKSGIIISDELAKENTPIGIVENIADNVTIVKIGDNVIFNGNGIKLVVDGIEKYIIEEYQVIAKIISKSKLL